MIIKFLTFLLGLFGGSLPKDQPDEPRVVSASSPVQTSAQDHFAEPNQMNVPGKPVVLGGRSYIIAPLNAAAVKQYRDEINAVFIGGLPDIGLVSKLAHASLRRNYPTMTMESVENMLDYENYFEVWEALMNLSGLVAQAKEMVRRVQEQMDTVG